MQSNGSVVCSARGMVMILGFVGTVMSNYDDNAGVDVDVHVGRAWRQARRHASAVGHKFVGCSSNVTWR